MTMAITEQEIIKARLAWGDALIAISKAFEEGGIEQARPVASAAIDDLYGFEFGPILFKPTLSGGLQTFRPTKEGTLSYFVGHDETYPQDGGFGLNGWRSMESETSSFVLEDNMALWMGWIMLTNKEGSVVKVDKSFGYKKSEDGRLKIVLHHSSLPFEA